MPFCLFWGESSPTKIDYREKLASLFYPLLEDLADSCCTLAKREGAFVHLAWPSTPFDSKSGRIHSRGDGHRPRGCFLPHQFSDSCGAASPRKNDQQRVGFLFCCFCLGCQKRKWPSPELQPLWLFALSLSLLDLFFLRGALCSGWSKGNQSSRFPAVPWFLVF